MFLFNQWDFVDNWWKQVHCSGGSQSFLLCIRFLCLMTVVVSPDRKLQKSHAKGFSPVKRILLSKIFIKLSNKSTANLTRMNVHVITKCLLLPKRFSTVRIVAVKFLDFLVRLGDMTVQVGSVRELLAADIALSIGAVVRWEVEWPALLPREHFLAHFALESFRHDLAVDFKVLSILSWLSRIAAAGFSMDFQLWVVGEAKLTQTAVHWSLQVVLSVHVDVQTLPRGVDYVRTFTFRTWETILWVAGLHVGWTDVTNNIRFVFGFQTAMVAGKGLVNGFGYVVSCLMTCKMTFEAECFRTNLLMKFKFSNDVKSWFEGSPGTSSHGRTDDP